MITQEQRQIFGEADQELKDLLGLTELFKELDRISEEIAKIEELKKDAEVISKSVDTKLGMLALLQERERKIKEEAQKKEDEFKSDLESVGKATNYEDAMDVVTELLCKYEPPSEEEGEEQIPLLGEEDTATA